MNSIKLYLCFIRAVAKRLLIVDMGDCTCFLSMKIICDRENKLLWLSSKAYIEELLEDWNMDQCTPSKVPFYQNLSELPDPPTSALPNIAHEDLKVNYQKLVGSLLYLALADCLDIAYHAIALSQYCMLPTRTVFLAAKQVLRYLSGTWNMALRFGLGTCPDSLMGFMKCIGCSDSDWASSSDNRWSTSGYVFFL